MSREMIVHLLAIAVVVACVIEAVLMAFRAMKR